MAATESSPDAARVRPSFPLAGLSVVECGQGVAAAYAGKLLAMLGADVIKVEPSGGRPQPVPRTLLQRRRRTST